MSTLVSQIHPNVVKELQRRRGAVSATSPSDSQLRWLHGKTPWVKMQSNAVFVGEDGVTVHAGRNKVSKTLFGSWMYNKKLVPFETMYVGTANRPIPGITGLTSNIKGTLGMMREVTVDFKVFSLDQLELMQELFMIPGIGVLVEWGWSINQMQQLSIPLQAQSPPTEENRWLRQTVQNKILNEGRGTYDALFGLICDFSIKASDDGTWDCSTTIVGPGSMTVDINLKTPSNALDDKLITFVEDCINKELSNVPFATKQPSYKMAANLNDIQENMDLPVSVDEQQAKKSNTDTSLRQSENLAKTNLFVTWGFVEAVLNEFFYSQERSNFAKSGFIDSYLKTNDGEIIPCGSVGDGGRFWRSLSPANMLIPGHPSSLVSEFFLGNSKQIKGFSQSQVDLGDLSAVWINYHTVVKPALEGSETIGAALTQMLNKMNEGAGGVWNLQLLFNDENFAQYRVVDAHCTVGSPNENEIKSFVFEINTKNSLVRSAEVSLIIPNALKSTVMIAANAPQDVLNNGAIADRDKVGIFKSLTRGVVDAFATKMSPKLPFESTDNARVPLNNAGNDNRDIGSQGYYQRLTSNAAGPANQTMNFPVDLENAGKKRWFEELTGNEKTAVINYIFTRKEQGKTNIHDSALIPLDVTITLDGIGGLSWGNAFSITNVPRKYRENAFFQIKSVSHSVNEQGWTTQIIGLMRPLYHPRTSADLNSVTSAPLPQAPVLEAIQKPRASVQESTFGMGPFQ